MTHAGAALQHPAALADLLPEERVCDVALPAGGAATTELVAQVSVQLPSPPVPITLQTLALPATSSGLVVPWFAGGIVRSGFARLRRHR